MSQTCHGHSGPNAVFLPNYGPCNPQTGSVSLCCEIGQTCLTNGLCVSQSGVYYSGGCTDSTYQAAICPKFCTSGDANWVVQCPSGAAVKDGDFCCSVNGTTKTCCDTSSNGLGLVAAVSSAQAVSATSVGASTVPVSISNVATTSSSESVASSPTFTPSRTAPHISEKIRNNNTGFPIGFTVGLVGVLVLWGIFWAIVLLVRLTKGRHERHRPRTSIAAMIKRELERRNAHRRARRIARRRAESNNIAMNDLRGRSDDKSGSQIPPTEGAVPIEADGSQARPAEMDADGTHVAPRLPPPAVALDNNLLSEPLAMGGFWYNANLGSF